MTANTYEAQMQAAGAAFDAGFASEASRKAALATVTRAFEALGATVRGELLKDERDDDNQLNPASKALYWSFPDYPHHWNAKAAAAFGERFPEICAQAQACADLRAAMKDATVAPRPAPAEDHPLLALAKADAKTVWDRIEAQAEKRRADYSDTLDLGRQLAATKGAPLEGLPVSVHRVFCGNYAGTRWLRLDWYLSGRRVAFSVVAAAYDTLVREGTIKGEDQ